MTAVLTRPTSTERPPGVGATLAVLLAGQFMAVLDAFVVNVAAPSIRRDLHTSGAGLQLIVAGYTVAYAVLLITGARLGDRLGPGRVFRGGLALFTVASLACGLAPGETALIAFRVVQGVGAAAMMPQVMSLIQRTFTGAARARALSLYAAVLSCGAVVGQVLGGVLVSADLFGAGWRPIFLVNVPIGALLLALAPARLPSGRGDAGRRMDPAGVVTLSLGVLLLTVPLVLGHEEHWPVWGWLCLAASAVVLGVFALVERRVGRRGGAPLVSARLLRTPGLLAGVGVLLLAMLGYAGFLFATALHLQSGLGYGPATAGLIFAPSAIAFAVTGLSWQRLPVRWHARVVPLGLGAAAAAYLLLALALRGGTFGGLPTQAVLVLLGLALGLAISPVVNVTLIGVPLAAAADASGVLVTTIQLAQVIGVATLGTVFLSALHGVAPHGSAHAISITLVVVSASTFVAALAALGLVRPHRNATG